MEENLVCKLVGLRTQEPLLKAYLASLNSPSQTIRFEADEIYYNKYPELGMSFLFEEPDDILTCIFLYADEIDGFKEYQGKLPNSLNFSDTRRGVLQRLGQPVESGGDEYFDMVAQVIPPWDNYNMEGYLLNITYGYRAETIRMVAVMPLPK